MLVLGKNEEINMYKVRNRDGKIIPLVLIKYFTFGNIINLYSILKVNDQQNIAEYFKQNNCI